VWLAVDSPALIRALTTLVPGDLRLRLVARGSHAELEIAAGEPVGALPAGALEVLAHHGAEAWAEGARVRVLFPVLPRRAPPPVAADPAPRPVVYDFDLFRRLDADSELDARPLRELQYTVFDTETTGLDPRAGDELVSIGAVRIVNGRLLAHDTFEQLIDPRRAISPASVRIHGITRDMLAGKPTVEQVLPRFAQFAEDTVLVGHNVAFDMQFIERKGVRLHQPMLDTLLLSAAAQPEERDHTLERLASRLGLSVVGRHTALGDAMLTAEVFLGLIRMLEARGVVTLGQARAAARSTDYARVSDSLYAAGG
jgi:DNA polymerase-3 subunit epsilon